MDFLEKLKLYIESKIDIQINIGNYNINKSSVAIVPMPSSIETRYLEGKKQYPFTFQILYHEKDHDKAYQGIEYLRNELDNFNIKQISSDNGSFDLVSIRCTSNPSYVQETNYGALYTASFVAELYTM